MVKPSTTTVADSLPTGATEAEIPAPRVVLFDFDGVLIHGDAFGLLIRERYVSVWWRKALMLMTMPLWLPLLLISRRRGMWMLIHLALLGQGEAGYQRKTAAFAAQLVRRPGLLCRDGLIVLRRHQAAGDRVLVVTGSERHLVESILKELGLTNLEVLASQLRPGLLGMATQRHNFSERKLESLAEQGLWRWSRAYTDSLYDVPMLRQAEEAVLVNGDPKLCKKMEQALGRSILRVEWR